MDFLYLFRHQPYETGTFSRFRRKATSQGVIKKCFGAEIDKINNHYKSNHDLKMFEKLNFGFQCYCNAVNYCLDFFGI